MTLVRLSKTLLITLTLWAVALVAGLIWGGPTPPPTLEGFNNPFKGLDYSELPSLSTYPTQEGSRLAYRKYVPDQAALGSVTLIHGSSASSQSMHPLALALSRAGYEVWSLDMRGHGASGERGHIDHVGQLEQDMAAFVAHAKPQAPVTLLGFSSGGGFALRLAGSREAKLFDHYLLMAPFISERSPTQKPNSGGWVDVGVPRIVALSALNAVGLTHFNHLPVTAFALAPEAVRFLTPSYSYNLATNFRPESDYLATMARVQQPVAVLAGTHDEAFHTFLLPDLVQEVGQSWRVVLLPNLGHIDLLTSPQALAAAVQLVTEFD